jgi:hypothetical protein
LVGLIFFAPSAFLLRLCVKLRTVLAILAKAQRHYLEAQRKLYAKTLSRSRGNSTSLCAQGRGGSATTEITTVRFFY